MSLATLIQPSHRTLTVFFCLMLVLGIAFGWLGWQLLAQEQALEKQRSQERLEQAADRIASAFGRSLDEVEAYLSMASRTGPMNLPDGAAYLRVNQDTLEVHPSGSLLYYPVAPIGIEPPDTVFAEGERLEHRSNDPAGAVEVFKTLAESGDVGVRAGALLRLGRNLRKVGRNEEALEVYRNLGRLGLTPLLGRPAELMAYEARCTVLDAMGSTEDLRRDAERMQDALWSGRWVLLHSVWEFHEREARRWAQQDHNATERERCAMELAKAAAWLYAQQAPGSPSTGRQVIEIEGRPVLVSWKASRGEITALLAGSGVFLEMWRQAQEGERIRAALVDSQGKSVLGSLDAGAVQAVRTSAETRLPWSLYVNSADPGADLVGLRGRRRLLMAGFAVIALVLVSGSLFILRSIAREQAVMRLQSEFVSAVSHEFRTPLTSLRQLSEMLAGGRMPTEESRQHSYEMLASESERLQQLVESLLDFGRIEAGTFRFQFEEVDPVALVRGVVVEFQEKVSAAGYLIEIAAGGEFPFIRADRDALSLALRNLLDNAVKYSPDCRTVQVEMVREREFLAIHVHDRGLGIPAAEQKKIFERFVRGSGSGSANIKGTGIGLALARRIVAAHGGEIRLESEPGSGSTFTILLPAA